MREAVVVSTARTPIGRAWRGAFNDTQPQELAAHAIAAAIERAGVEPDEIEDVLLGCAMPEGAAGVNVARQAALRAGLPDSVPGMTMDRQCASGLAAIATAAKEIVSDGLAVAIGGGVESISLVQREMNRSRARDPWLVQHRPEIYSTMLTTAEIVAHRYGIAGLGEARAYLDHPLLGARLEECTRAMLAHAGTPSRNILGVPDDLKFVSCMTLFDAAGGSKALFEGALQAFNGGIADAATLRLLDRDAAI